MDDSDSDVGDHRGRKSDEIKVPHITVAVFCELEAWADVGESSQRRNPVEASGIFH